MNAAIRKLPPQRAAWFPSITAACAELENWAAEARSQGFDVAQELGAMINNSDQSRVGLFFGPRRWLERELRPNVLAWRHDLGSDLQVFITEKRAGIVTSLSTLSARIDRALGTSDVRH